MTKPKLYALLIGINNYPRGIRKLAGCHNDVRRMQTYLAEQDDYFELAIAPPLLDEQATKANIVCHFRSYFQAAQAEDTVLFYFSGHGIREEADPELWPNEYDKKLEGLVCYNPVPWNGVDSNERVGPNVLLVDKELRYLIWELMQTYPPGQGPHVVILVDSCHSGDVTRVSVDHQESVRRVEFTARARALGEFIFPADWLQQKQGSSEWGSEDYLEGAHVQMGACQANQLAKETALGPEGQISGVFTYYLLAFLRHNQGNLSYYDLRYHLKVFTRFRHGQVPQVYIPSSNQALYHQGFLNRPIQAGKPFVAQLHHDEEKGWILNKGGLDAVSRRTRVKVKIDTERSIEVQPTEVQADLSVLDFSPQDQASLDPQRTYQVQMEGLRGEPLNVFINVQEPQEGAFLSGLQAQLLEQVKGLNFVGEAREGIYTLHLIGGEYRLSQNNDPFRPLVRPILRQATGAIQILGQYLRQISQWEYARGLQSEEVDQAAFSKGFPLEIIVSMRSEDGQYYPKMKEADEQVRLPLTKQGGKWSGRVRVNIRNKYDHPLWICPLYLDTDFSVSKLLKTLVLRLEPQSELMIFETNIHLKAHFYDYNWPADVSIIQVLVSTKDNLEVLPLLMEKGLPLPITLNVNRDTGSFNDKDQEVNLSMIEGWLSQSLILYIPNPEYNQISAKKLAAMRAHVILKDYVEEIFREEEKIN